MTKKTKLLNQYLKLFKENSVLSDPKALDTELSALKYIHYQELELNKLRNNRTTVELLSILNYLFLIILLVGFYQLSKPPVVERLNTIITRKHIIIRKHILEKELIKENIDKKQTNIVTKRTTKVIEPTVNKELKHTNKSKFISSKINKHNPAVDADQLSSLIVDKTSLENIDPILISSLILYESGFNAKAKSSMGAVGLMQVLPATASYMVSINLIDKSYLQDLYNEEYNLVIGIRYLKYLLDIFKGDMNKALMAYNWGPDKVLKSKGNIHPPVKNYAKNIIFTSGSWKKEFGIIT